MNPQADLAARAKQALTPNYNPAPISFARGEGMWLYDEAGKRYLDFAAGIAVSALGHAHPALVEAISAQAREVLHTSNLFLVRHAIELAEKLNGVCFSDRVYFGNSGAEANEAAFKIARRYMRLVRGEDRFEFICAHGSFHGRTWAAITATGQPKYQKGFAPLVPGFLHVPYDDLAAVEAAIGPHTCAVFVEPIQGESGVVPPQDGYLEGLRALCDRHGILLMLDEIQTGVGRTGAWFAHQHTQAAPDVMTLAKGLAGGVPIGAMLCTNEVARGFEPGAHASTFGGNPFATRAGLAVFDVIERDGLIENAEKMGTYLNERLAGLSSTTPGVVGARGRGLMQALVVDEAVDRAAIGAAARARGLLLTLAGHDALRLVPPLIVGKAHIDEAVELLADAVRAVVTS